MKKILITLSLILATNFAFAQDDAKALAMDVIKQSGSLVTMELAKNQILGMIPEAKHAEFSKDFDALMPSLYEQLSVMYTEVYTVEELKQMVAFYQTPIGKKMADSAGTIFEKTNVIQQEWGMELQTMMMKYMQ